MKSTMFIELQFGGITIEGPSLKIPLKSIMYSSEYLREKNMLIFERKIIIILCIA